MSKKDLTNEDREFLLEACRMLDADLENSYNRLINLIGKLEAEDRDKMLKLLFSNSIKEK